MLAISTPVLHHSTTPTAVSMTRSGGMRDARLRELAPQFMGRGWTPSEGEWEEC